MAKKQSRRSVSMSKATYERLRAFCEVNEQSMSQFVEARIGDYLGRKDGARAVASGSSTTSSSSEGSKPAKKLTGDHIFTF